MDQDRDQDRDQGRASPGAGLAKRATKGTLFFVGALWLLIFLPAGSLAYWQGWLFWAHFALWSGAAGWYFLQRDPALVQRRLRAGPAAEKEPTQKRIQLALAIVFCALFVVSALDGRFGWSAASWPVVLAGNLLVAAGYLFVFLVLRENSFAASTIEVSPDQTVISTGPYALVRHPMYAGALLMFAGVPLALASWWGLVPFGVLVGGLVARLQDEEAYLARNLPGYEAYRETVCWRLVPGVW
ncbi:MAG: isoprenylcysteine carboxylmethyltransferase family protein [Hyphomicrobiaceae bacterium]|nr:isoprenylcysteine carboxylmethyltransferase family protein [Hyphomicrobiaceae bacterium]